MDADGLRFDCDGQGWYLKEAAALHADATPHHSGCFSWRQVWRTVQTLLMWAQVKQTLFCFKALSRRWRNMIRRIAALTQTTLGENCAGCVFSRHRKWKLLACEVAFMSSFAFNRAGFTACLGESGVSVFTAFCFRDTCECLKVSDMVTAGKHFVYLCNWTIKKSWRTSKTWGWRKKNTFSFLHLTSGFFFGALDQ